MNCWHNCSILGETGAYWPLPTFEIRAEDSKEPIVAKSATGAWTAILNRIKAAIITRWVTFLMQEGLPYWAKLMAASSNIIEIGRLRVAL